MKSKLLVFSTLLLGIIFLKVNKVSSRNIMDAWISTPVDNSSATIFSGSGYVKAIYLSSDTFNTSGDYAFLVDSANVTPNSTLAAYSTAQKKGPTLVYQATYTATYLPYWVFPDAGLYFSSACVLQKTLAASGEALRAWVFWSK